MVVRAVDSKTRLRLFARLDVTEMVSLRSFLDPPMIKGSTVKGSGDVGYAIHTQNHTREVVEIGTELHRQVRLHPLCLPMFVYQLSMMYCILCMYLYYIISIMHPIFRFVYILCFPINL